MIKLFNKEVKVINESQRPSWDVYWMMGAMLVAERASCNKNIKVGAVIVDENKRVLATGYNGSPPGEPHCMDADCLILPEMGKSCQRVIHAEKNAIFQLALSSSRGTPGSTMYVTHFPCLDCMKAISSVGIKRVVFWKKHDVLHYKERYEVAEDLARRSTIEISKLLRDDVEYIMNLMRKKHEELSLDLAT